MKIGISKNSVITSEASLIKKYISLSSLKEIILDFSLIETSEYELLDNIPPLDLPINNPSKIICLAKNYPDHAVEMGVEPRNLPPIPSLFLKPPSSLLGPNRNIYFPPEVEEIHHEIELAVVIGKKGKNIEPLRSIDYIFGYSILLDITARDFQAIAKKEGRPWFVSKGFDTFCPLGPFIVLKNEILNPQNLDLELKVNGKIRQKGNTSQMIFSIPDIISYCSTITTLEPGDIIATGTPSGVGPLAREDKITATIQSIGTLEIGVD